MRFKLLSLLVLVGAVESLERTSVVYADLIHEAKLLKEGSHPKVGH